ncbi:unnamed protein product [Victoria cruziana]
MLRSGGGSGHRRPQESGLYTAVITVRHTIELQTWKIKMSDQNQRFPKQMLHLYVGLWCPATSRPDGATGEKREKRKLRACEAADGKTKRGEERKSEYASLGMIVRCSRRIFILSRKHLKKVPGMMNEKKKIHLTTLLEAKPNK